MTASLAQHSLVALVRSINQERLGGGGNNYQVWGKVIEKNV